MPAPRVERTFTTRGRAFLATGITAIVCGLLVVERDLVRAGVFVTLIPLLSAIYVARRRHLVTARRHVSPPSVAVGASASVLLELHSTERDSGRLLAEDRIPYSLGERPRLDLTPLVEGETRTLSYPITAQQRGKFELGPLRLRVSDPLGMVESMDELPGTTFFIATPRVIALPGLDLWGGRFGAGGETARVFASGDVSDASIREYRRGDDLRRVHWPTTARVGDLMVRREELPAQSSATIVWDNRAECFQGPTAARDFEAAVSAVASITVALVNQRFHVQLATAEGHTEVAASARGQDVWPILARLAEIAPNTDSRWTPPVHVMPESLVFAVVGPAAPTHPGWAAYTDTERVRRLAISVGSDADPHWLSTRGWHTATWEPNGSWSTGLRTAWQKVAQ